MSETYKSHRYPNLPCYIYQCVLRCPGDLYHGTPLYLAAPDERVASAQFMQMVGKAAASYDIALLEECGIDSCAQAKVKHNLLRNFTIERTLPAFNHGAASAEVLDEFCAEFDENFGEPQEDFGWAGQTE